MSTPRPAAPGGRYPLYVLGVLVVVYVFNFLDRQVLSILAERIKADLGLSDAQMGYLYGTAFAVFYAIFGIPLGRLADAWDRRKLIAIGLGAWSVMTALSGLARSFSQLALARFGVAVGEASASPAAYSLLCDYFPPQRRATVLALYSSGIYLGAGLGLGLGGLVVDRWDHAFAGAAAPFGLRGWQVAFFVVGLPGLLLSLWVRTLREPPRGGADGLPGHVEPQPFRLFWRELRAVLPPLTLVNLALLGARRTVVLTNLGALGGAVLAPLALTWLLGDAPQWVSLGLGAYAAFSWAQSLRLRDPAAHALIFRSPALRYASLAFALLSFTGYGWGFWMAPYLIRQLGADVGRTGFVLGGIAAAGGWLGVTFGGVLADALHRRSPAGRLQVGMLTAVLPLPFAVALLAVDDLTLAFALNLPLYILTSMWLGPGTATVQELVLPRMRATASAAFLLVVTFVGLALGPYTIGKLSVGLGGLRPALLCSLGVSGLALFCALRAAHHLPGDQASMCQRADAAEAAALAA